MDRATLYIVKQNYLSNCFKCDVKKKFFTVYRCGKCEPQTVEKYCYECCEKAILKEDDEISALCMECAFCYDFINVSKFYKDQKDHGWQGLKFDCSSCSCCCGSDECITGSLCCCESDDEADDDEKKDKNKSDSDDEKKDKNK